MPLTTSNTIKLPNLEVNNMSSNNTKALTVNDDDESFEDFFEDMHLSMLSEEKQCL